VPSGKALDHVSMYGTDPSDEENAENMYQLFVNLPAEVITQGVSVIHAEFSKFFRAEYFNGELTRQSGSLALMRGIQQCFIDIQNRCVLATDELSRLVIETASQRPATLKDFRTQELALERQTQLWELSKFEPIGSRQEEIAKKFCRFQIREEGSRLNIATQNAIGFALSRFLDPNPGEDVPTINLKKVFSTCRDKFCSINGAPVGCVLDEGMRHERAMLAQTETKSKGQFGNRNGRTDKSCGLDPQFNKLKKDLSLAHREISNLKNKLHQAKENFAKERAERSSKSRKDDSPDEEVGGKRVRQHAKRAKASRPGTSSPSPPRKGFRMLQTGNNSDSEEEDDYPEPNVRATYAKAKFAAFNQLSRRRLHYWMLSPDQQRQGQGKL
jgi:hypothetical protein